MTTTRKYVGPSQRCENTVRQLARKSVKLDGWMTPVSDAGHRETEVKTDYGAFEQAHIAGWEETCHFDHFYGRTLGDLAEQQMKRFGLDKADDWETYHYSFYCPLRDLFWEEWNSAHKLYEFWKANVRTQTTFNVRYNVGKSKYVVNHHDGITTHPDGSRFFDLAIFSNKREFEAFIAGLRGKGYIEN